MIQGDATALLDECLQVAEGWCAAGEISGLVCSAQGVLHELPTRSPGFDLPVFLGKIFRYSKWKTAAFYSREPCAPAGWPDKVRIRIAGLTGEELARFAKYVRDRLRMSGIPETLASNWVVLPAMLAIETLHKLIRGGSIRRIGYELGEQLTGFDAIAVKKHLESSVDGMRVTVDQVTTSGFKKALQEFDVEYVGHSSDCLPVPRTHSEIVGFATVASDAAPRPAAKGPVLVHLDAPVRPLETPFSNPFKGDVSDAEIMEWLRQFASEERPLVARLLDGFTYISFKEMRTLAVKLHARVTDCLGDAIGSAWFVPMGRVAKSSGVVSYIYRVENGIPQDRFIDRAELPQVGSLENGAIVFLDDLLATGHQAAAQWEELRESARIPSSCRVLLATLVSCEAGEAYIDDRTDLLALSAIKLTSADEPLSPASRLFPNEAERQLLRQIVWNYGEVLAPKGPLGYAGTGLLLGFEHSTPDNTLPVFWSSAVRWNPLLNRGGSVRMGTDTDVTRTLG